MSRRSPAWYDTQYNNRARIPEHMDILREWFERSAAVRRRRRCTLDVRYGEGEAERLDLFHPSRAAVPAGGAPVLVYLHGGYWRALGKGDQSFIAEPFARAGALVVLPDYALCPAVSIEHIVMQMVRALIWVHDNAARLGADPARIVVAGHSAGGHLAAMLLACRWRWVDERLPANLVQAALSLSGVFDVEPLRHAPFLAPDLKLASAAAARRVSPLHVAAPGAGELVALVGADESAEFVRQNRLIEAAWGSGVVTVCRTLPQRHHMNILADLAEAGTLAHQQTRRLLGLQ